MNRRLAWVLVAAAIALMILTAVLVLRDDTSSSPAGDGRSALELVEVTDSDLPRTEVALYFPGPGSRLYPERREVVFFVSDPATREHRELDSHERVRYLVEQLLRGPDDDRLRGPFDFAKAHQVPAAVDGSTSSQDEPAGATDSTPPLQVGSVELMPDGTVYVDFRSAIWPTPPSTGSTDEMLRLYSVVQTVVENIESATAVVVLWNGRQPTTFAGHVDTTHPLLPLRSLVADNPG